MSAILEAYWLLAAKRFVDNVCMTLDKKIMGAVAHKMQGEGELPRGGGEHGPDDARDSFPCCFFFLPDKQ